mgnify:CR=1 FL=1
MGLAVNILPLLNIHVDQTIPKQSNVVQRQFFVLLLYLGSTYC